jgi:hypothetical protein
MNPEKDCPNAVDASRYVIFYQGRMLVLCKECGPQFQFTATQNLNS